jgi:anthranilate phosphoribosyltransferase
VIDRAIERIAAGEKLKMQEMSQLMDTVMEGQVENELLAKLLTSLHERGETVEEIAGAAASLRRHMTPIRSQRTGLIDTCGTGGDRSGTFNISTAAALVTAAAGVPVAKHGNRSITSKSGSADVLAALGVNIEASVPTVEKCLDRLGICFCFAPLMHPSMRHVAAVRKQLGTPTIFNLLGPLCNPASAPFQLLGVGRPGLREPLAKTLQLLGIERAAVVSGDDGLDEVTLATITNVSLVEGSSVTNLAWQPEDFGLVTSPLDPLKVKGPEASAEMIREVLAGLPGAARDIVVLNAAAALWTARHCESLPEAARAAAAAIDEGRARRLLDQLVEVSGAQ